MSETRTSRRVSMSQLLHLWEFLNNHREIAVGYNKSTQAREHSKRMWERVAEILNSAGEGSVKSASEWSKYWVDMKAKLKKKNRLISDSRRRTGGGPGINLELSEIDRKFLSILGEDLGSGLPGVRVEPQVPQECDQNIAGPSNMDTSQSTTTEEPIYLSIPSSEEYPLLEPNEVMAEVTTSQHSAQSPVCDNVPVPANPQSSPSRQGITGQGARRCLVLPTEAEPSRLSRQSTAQQGPTRRRRRQRQQPSAADAREQLVIATQRRTQAELANSHSVKRITDFFGEIVSILRNIHARQSRRRCQRRATRSCLVAMPICNSLLCRPAGSSCKFTCCMKASCCTSSSVRSGTGKFAALQMLCKITHAFAIQPATCGW